MKSLSLSFLIQIHREKGVFITTVSYFMKFHPEIQKLQSSWCATGDHLAEAESGRTGLSGVYLILICPLVLVYYEAIFMIVWNIQW